MTVATESCVNPAGQGHPDDARLVDRHLGFVGLDQHVQPVASPGEISRRRCGEPQWIAVATETKGPVSDTDSTEFADHRDRFAVGHGQHSNQYIHRPIRIRHDIAQQCVDPQINNGNSISVETSVEGQLAVGWQRDCIDPNNDCSLLTVEIRERRSTHDEIAGCFVELDETEQKFEAVDLFVGTCNDVLVSVEHQHESNGFDERLHRSTNEICPILRIESHIDNGALVIEITRQLRGSRSDGEIVTREGHPGR